jgi:tRNA 2-(methylsulfanyl)-N6-isopentenyladenosine37 hydroxylase
MNVNSFLNCPTPKAWLDRATSELPVLLIDHANCEKKAASTAMNLMYRYVDKPEMMLRLSKLAREELRHFEQVLGFMEDRNVSYTHITPARYAGSLRKDVRHAEPARLTDILIVCAIVEARSCERFEKLIEVLDAELAAFYSSLLRSEARHFTVYLGMAEKYAQQPIDDRIAHFLAVDEQLIVSPDEDFRFHSGVPMSNDSSETDC